MSQGDWLYDNSANKFNNTYFRDYNNTGFAVDMSGDLIVRNGNVGIGETNPENILHVRGNGPQLLLEGQTNEKAKLRFSSGPSYGDKFHEIETEFYAMSGFGSTNKMHFKVNEGGQSDSPGTRMTIVGNGNVGIGTTSPSEPLTVKNNSGLGIKRTYYDDYLMRVNLSGGNYTPGDTGKDSCMIIGSGSGTNRSISARGTLNASGNDYAEYMYKANVDDVFKKGDVVGVNNNGKITKLFDESLLFLVKSTNPALIGGDEWNTCEVPFPVIPSITNDDPSYNEIMEEYNSKYTIWNDAMNISRKVVDRIAFCGQVPINYTNGNPGDWILAHRKDDGTIGITHKSSLTFDEYIHSVGRCIKKEDDGRCLIIVKIC